MAIVQTGPNSWTDTTTGKAVAAPAQTQAPKQEQTKDQQILAGLGFGYDQATATQKLKEAGYDPAKYRDQMAKQIKSYQDYTSQSAQHGMTDDQKYRQQMGWTPAQQAAAKAAAEQRLRAQIDAENQASATTRQSTTSPAPPAAQITSPVGADVITDTTGNQVNVSETATSPNNRATSPTANSQSTAATSQNDNQTTPTTPAETTKGTDSDWMKEVYKQWQEAYAKEKDYRDNLMGQVNSASYDPAQAMAFAQQQAQEGAARDTDNASRQAIKAARTAGINPAQAALIAGQNASGAYNTALGQQQQQALSQYNASRQQLLGAAGLTGQMQGQLLPSAVQMQGNQLNYQAAMQGYQNAKTAEERDFWGRMLFGMAPLAGALFSDKGVKDNIKTVSYTYKGQSRPELGVLAQDLEKTPLKTSVFAGPGGVKMIDTNRLTTQNTAMIADLARKVDKIADLWAKGDK